MIDVSQRQRNILICVCLILATVAVYWPVGNFPFVEYDDPGYIYENPHLREGLTLRGLGWAFTTGLDQWMPLTWLVRILEYQVVGLNSGVHHLINMAFHIANTLLLFAVLKRMTAAPWRSALVAALFALHPLHVESVAWATGLKDVQSMFFALLTIWAYVSYVKKLAVRGSQEKVFYCLTLAFFVLALMSKPMVVTLPFVLLLLDYWPLGRTHWAKPASIGTTPVTGEGAGTSDGQLLKEKLPFLALAVASCGVTYYAQRHLGVVPSLGRFPLGMRIANALLSYVGYIGKALWPTGLAVFYPLDPSLSTAAAVVAGIGLAVATAAVVAIARRAPWLATGWFWFLGTLVPVIGLVQVGSQSMADRYTYLPFVGLFIMLSWTVPWSTMESRVGKVITSIGAGSVLVVCAVLSGVQVGYWKDSEMLFRHALSVTRGNWLAHYNLGVTLEKAGRLDDAMGQYEQALRIRRDYAEAGNNLGGVLAKVGKVQEAISYYQQALRIKPDMPEAHYNLALALKRVGRIQDAIEQYELALRIKPDYAEAYNNLGNILWQAGKFEAAIANYQQAVRLKPDLADAHRNLGVGLMQLGRSQEAIEHFEQALRLKPDSVETHFSLGLAFEQTGKLLEAIGQYDKVLQIKPDSTEVQNNLAWLLATLASTEGGNPVRAVSLAQRACALTGNRLPAYLDTLAVSYAAVGQFNDAIATAQKAIELASSAGQAQIIKEIETRLELYRNGRAYRQSGGPATQLSH